MLEEPLAGHRRKATGPDRKSIVTELADVGRHPVHDDAGASGLARGEGDAAADGRVAAVTDAVDHQHVPRPQLPQRIVDDGRVDAGEADGDGGSGDALVGEQRPNLGIHEAEIEEVPDRRRLGLDQKVGQLAIDLRG